MSPLLRHALLKLWASDCRLTASARPAPAAGAGASRSLSSAPDAKSSESNSAPTGPDPDAADSSQGAGDREGPSNVLPPNRDSNASRQPQSTGRLRSLAEIFQPAEELGTEQAGEDAVSLTASLAPPTTAPIAASAQDAASQQQQQQKQQQQIRVGDRLVSPDLGFAALGAAQAGSHPRLHPTRTFAPGETYAPEDLNPFAPRGPFIRRAGRASRMPSPREAAQLSDYKNVGFLEQYLTPAGKLVSRKVSKLPAPLHASVMREVKRARHMALIAGEARPEKRALQKLRELDAMERAQRQQAAQRG